MEKTREELREEAKDIGLELDYEPTVQMYDIRLLPDEYWHKNRQTGWGGSNEGDLYGMGYSSIEIASYEKICGVKPEVNDNTQFIFDVGHAMEWVMLKRYAAINGYKFLTYKDYFVIVETTDNPTTKFPKLAIAMKDVYSYVTRDENEARCLLTSLQKEYPNARIVEQESNDPKDVRDITPEEHTEYDSKGIVCVDRRQYRHPIYTSMLGDMDGLCINPEGKKIGIECKTYGHMHKGRFVSGVLGETGKIKNPEYALQVRHYMAVENIDRFDIVATCGNNPGDFTITTVYRDVDNEIAICETCDEKWKDIEKGDIPEPTSLTKEQYAKLIEIQTMDKKEDCINLSDSYLDQIKEIEKINENLQSLKGQMDDLEKSKLAAQDKIVMAMNGYTEANIPINNKEYYKVTNRGITKTLLDSDKLKANRPDIFEAYKKTSTSKPSLKFSKTIIK